MTTPSWANKVNPNPTVHNPPPEKPSVRRYTTKQVGVVGTVIFDLILARVALALGGVNILGLTPFAFLTDWGNALQQKANDAYLNAFAVVDVVAGNPAGTTTTGTLNQVYGAASNINTATNSNTGNIQTTWNQLWEAASNQSTSTNKTIADVKTVSATVRSTAFGASGAASTANQNIDLTWDGIWNGASMGYTRPTGVTSVQTATGNIYYVANDASGRTTTNTGNIQSTWNSIYVGAGGTAPGNKSLSDAQNQLLGLNNTAVGASGNIYATWEEYFLNIYGWRPDTLTSPDFGAATKDTQTTITDLGDRVNDLESNDGGETFSGENISVNFNDYSVGALPNPPWTVNYPSISGGFGSGTLQVNSDKRVAWADSGGSKRRGIAIYNAKQLKTTYHKVSAVFAGWPQQGASNWLVARSNSTGSTCIMARIYINTFLFFWNSGFTVELYSVSNNTVSAIGSSTTTTLGTASSTWTLECGTDTTDNGQNTFRVLVDGKEVINTGVLSGTANGGNYVGFGLESANLLVNFLPAPVSSFTAFDNTPAAYLGCGFTAVKGTSTAYTLTATTDVAAIPAAAWTATPIPATGGLTSSANNVVTATVEGWYAVHVAVKVNDESTNIQVGVLVNDTVTGIAGFANQCATTFVVYAKAGQTIKPAYRMGAAINVNITGGDNKTYWSVAFLNNTRPSNPTK